ncbi:MAG: hypothetical protein NXI01_07680 [Gammaproteobacteria bacterium]|nr:hypothetical protein [Gammaproteobacteria bacterium]
MNAALKKQTEVFWLSVIVLCLLSFWLQTHLYLHKDVALVSHIAQQFLQGETYAHNISDPNPPMIFYLYFVPIIVSKLSGIAVIYTLRTYILLLIMLSILCSHGFIKTLLGPPTNRCNKNMAYLLTYGLAYTLLFLPADTFGQREHFYVILTTPYLFLAACRLDNKHVSHIVAIFVGVSAGIGFAIKPFFLLTLLLIELLLVAQKRHARGWLRPESGICISIIMLYGLCVLLFYPAYLSTILPFWMPYFRGLAVPWTTVILTPSFIWCCAAIFLYVLKQETAHTKLKTVLILSITGNLIAYVIPQVTWYYHIFPALAMSCLYFTLVLGELADNTNNKTNLGCIGFLTLVIFFIPVNQSILRSISATLYFHTNNPEKKLIALFGSTQNKYMFFSMTHKLSHLEFYSKVQQIGSFTNCIWEYTRLGHYSLPFQNAMRSYALNFITHDLNTKKPQFIIVDVPSSKTYLKQTINFPKEYDQDKKFHAAWSHYTYLTRIPPYDIYQRK